MRAMTSGDRVCVGVSLLILLAAGANRLSVLPPADAAPYHRSVRLAGAAAPMSFGDWSGTDVPVPTEASSQLRPNVIISRRFRNALTAEQVSLLLVQCSDTRDLTPHYPPVCYPGRGLALVAALPKQWRLGDLTVAGTEYQFESNTFATDRLTIVDNFMVLPDGRTCPDMSEVRRQTGLRTRYFGAAQVQVVFSSDTPAQRRDQICTEVLTAYRPLIDAIRSGVHR